MPASPEDYMSAIEALNRLQTRSSGVSPNKEDKLKEMYKFLQRCDISMDKLDQLSVVHVTGTHGKGSTCAYTENILRNHGYRTGFYSSPHLLEENKDDMPLYFPFLTVLAFHVFLQSKIDVAIIEVGIGGEYDCTNIIRKTEVVGFTPINFDHTGQLGASVESIAWHKGGCYEGKLFGIYCRST
ncbi:hypothetical protein NQ317_002148 [Molorchus minor]|uniref:Mur ligase central domain-containing protein n=1 Tax=Molorchus minor TaxID=1323400 RepID=A0ABQ9JVL3_9CUCU|nr:hypothetical protein NQ317_002148 [Molorchus minor]